MKKRILGLALALVMIISLLPLTAMADEALPNMPKYLIQDEVSGRLENGMPTGKVVYVVFEDVKDETGAVIGNKPVVAEEVPADNYIKLEYVNGVCEVLFKNISYKRTGGSEAFLTLYKNGSKYADNFDVVITLEGENRIEGLNTKILITNTGDVTFTGSGSLKIYSKFTSNQLVQKSGEGDLYIKDTKLDIEVYNDSEKVGSTGTLVAAGNIIIDGSTVDIVGVKNNAIVTGTKYGTLVDETYGVTIKNSTVTAVSGSMKAVATNGKIVIENSTVELVKGAGNKNPFANSMPYVTGATVELKKAAGSNPSYKDASEYDIAEGTALTDSHAMIGFKTTHTCASQGDDGDCTTAVTCACGKIYTAAKEHTGVVTDCSKDTMCTNAGCTKVFTPATAHEAEEDDGDCTTAIKCKKCAQVVVAGAEKHDYTRTDCSVEATCAKCGKLVAAAGEHSGGKATCKEKAKCESCGVEYGELGACAPAADDGDCTTAIKCTVCGKETTAAKEHKYTDNADTTCDNEGCTHTRKVEAPSTKPENNGNPQDGDNTALVLFVTLMVASAAAFVCTKKFAVR